MDKNRDELLKKIKDEILDLKESPLYEERINSKSFPVIGEGNHFAEIMLIGEAPGKNEAKTGRPFCGQSGKILDELLKGISMDRKDVYITNIVKDRPPSNRDPNSEEISIYSPFLDRQINIIQPKIIATLGRYSMKYILDKFWVESSSPISEVHGKIFEGEAEYGTIKIIPLYHPAVALYNRKNLNTMIDDFKILRKYRHI